MPSAARAEGTGRSRRSRYVCETWRPIFPAQRGLASGIINPCATAADRRAGAGTLRTGYRGWSDGISTPSGTDALNHTNSVYERMCTEVILDKVCPSGRPHHFLTKKLFSIEWIRSATKLAGRTPRAQYLGMSHIPFGRRVRSWLRMNAGGAPNTCKSNGTPLRREASGERLSNTWRTCPLPRDSRPKGRVIPDTPGCRMAPRLKPRREGMAPRPIR